MAGRPRRVPTRRATAKLIGSRQHVVLMAAVSIPAAATRARASGLRRCRAACDRSRLRRHTDVQRQFPNSSALARQCPSSMGR